MNHPNVRIAHLTPATASVRPHNAVTVDGPIRSSGPTTSREDERPEMSAIGIVSVNVATPSVLASVGGDAIVSSIAKRPVSSSSLWLSRTNLEGDAQADLRVHGGPDKAVYAYPTEHLVPWGEELGLDLRPGAFGENLSIAGALEHEVCIGDTWRWGDALLQVTQPRSPCYKLAIHLQRPEIIKRMLAGERTGWYLRVVRAGTVPVDGPILVASRDPRGISVAAAFAAMVGRANVR